MKILKLFVFILSIAVLPNSKLYSQSENSIATLKHYLRKTTADTLLLPGDKIITEHLLINIPDSIYDRSEILVKKFNYQGIRKIHTRLTGQNSTVQTVHYTLQGRRKALKFLSSMMSEVDTNKEDLERQKALNINGVRINFVYKVVKRNHYFNFSLAQ